MGKRDVCLTLLIPPCHIMPTIKALFLLVK